MEEKTKHCKDCNQTLPISQFHKNGKTTMPTCKDCRQAARKLLNNPRKEGTKQCPGCELILPTAEFDSDKSQPDGMQSYCKKCKYAARLIYLSTYDGFIKNLFKDVRNNAKKRNIQVQITIKDITDLYTKQNGQCALTGIPMTFQATERTNNSEHILNKWNISVDRIDSKKGYIKDNIQLVCAIINRMKTTMTVNELLLLCGAISQTNYNIINKLIISKINNKCVTNYPIQKCVSMITRLLDEKTDKESINIKLDTAQQKYACSYNGYMTKLFLNCKHNLNKRAKKMQFTITEDDLKQLFIKQKGLCAISGKKMTYIGYQNKGSNNWNISVDRINSQKGYTKDNIQLVTGLVNRMKTDLYNDDLLLFCNNLYKKNFTKINNMIITLCKN